MSSKNGSHDRLIDPPGNRTLNQYRGDKNRLFMYVFIDISIEYTLIQQ